MDRPEDVQALGTICQVHVADEHVHPGGQIDRLVDIPRSGDQSKIVGLGDRGGQRREYGRVVVDDPDTYPRARGARLGDVGPSRGAAAWRRQRALNAFVDMRWDPATRRWKFGG